jgi:hypothetical protein
MIWKDVVGYEGFYQVNELGQIRRNGANKLLAINYGFDYDRVHFSKNGVKKKVSVHRVVLSAFIGNNPSLVANHKDGNTRNNSLQNLEWVTQKENIRHSYDVLKRRNSKAKYVLNVENGIFYDTIKEAAITTNYSYQSIRFKLTGIWPNNTNLIII